MIFAADGEPGGLEEALEQAIERRFGLSIPVLVRTTEQWGAYVRDNPFAQASEREPNLVMLGLSRSALRPDAVDALRQRAANGEQVAQSGDALWLHFAGGAGKSRLSPAVLDRTAGSPVTLRNWRTVVRLYDLARQAGG